jgi:hypothetical protein
MNETQVIITFKVGSKEQAKYLRGYLLLKGHGFTATHTTSTKGEVTLTLTAPVHEKVGK